jgi:hypothetical protein
MYYNGFSWKHETDAYGFRNAKTMLVADIVLLGDSNVYGHGLNLNHTIGHYPGEFTGLKIVNMARQGDSALQEAYLLTEYIQRFNPRYVFTSSAIATFKTCTTIGQGRSYSVSLTFQSHK